MFDGESYDYWSIKMKILLISKDLWEIVQEEYEVKVKPVMEILEETKKEKLGASVSVEEKENIKKDAKALYLIQQAISNKKIENNWG
jgi:Domain of unknown function (DUF4219)